MILIIRKILGLLIYNPKPEISELNAEYACPRHFMTKGHEIGRGVRAHVSKFDSGSVSVLMKRKKRNEFTELSAE